MRKKCIFLWKGIGLSVLLFVTLFPIYWLIIMAIRPTAETSAGAGLFPQQLTISHFTELFTQKSFGTALQNSLINAGTALVLSLALGLTTAYVLSRKRFRFRLRLPVTGGCC